MTWWDAMDAAESATSQGYDDWFLPNFDILQSIYNTIGYGDCNICGFEPVTYWSSSVYPVEGLNLVYFVDFSNGTVGNSGRTGALAGLVLFALFKNLPLII